MAGIDIVHIPYRGGGARGDRPDRRAGADDDRRDAERVSAGKGRADPRHRGVDRGAFSRRAGTARRSRNPGCPASKRARGTASSHRPARREPIVDKLNAAIRNALADPEIVEALHRPRRATGGRARRKISRSTSRRARTKWAAVVHASGREGRLRYSISISRRGRTPWTRTHCRRFPRGPPFPATRTSSTRRPTKASPRSRSTGPKCATPSGPRRCRRCSARSPTRATTPDDRRRHPHRRRARTRSARAATSACAATGGYVGDDGVPRLNVLDLQRQIRTLPKPVVAMVAGYAIGGGHVLHLVCDLTIAADNARFGQTGPRVGSFDGGFGASLHGAHRRPEEGARDLVPVPPVRRAAGARDGPRQHASCRTSGSKRRRCSGAARCSPTARSRCAA